MKKLFSILCISLFLFGCDSNKDHVGNNAWNLNFQPKKVMLSASGYAINQFTGDSIKPVSDKFGQVIQTGIMVPVTFEPARNVERPKPTVVKAGNPTSFKINHQGGSGKTLRNTQIIPRVRVQVLDQKGDPGFRLISAVGDTVSTGIPVPIVPKTITMHFPRPVIAGNHFIKDNATLDIRCLSTEQGIRAPQIQTAIKDKNGRLWFGGTKSGLTRYDGKFFTNFSIKEGLPDNNISAIYEDTTGNKWFGFGALPGIMRFNGKSFDYFSDNTTSGITTITGDLDGNIWYSGIEGGVCRLDGNFITHYTTKEGLADNKVTSMIVDKSGNLWFGTRKGLCFFDGKKMMKIHSQNEFTDEEINVLSQDLSGNIWFGTSNGLFKLEGENITRFTKEVGLTNRNILALYPDKTGNLWIGTEGGGIFILKGQSVKRITEEDGLSDNTINSILIDDRGIVWIGTENEGICWYNPNSFEHLTQKEGLPENPISSILEDDTGSIWFGTRGNGAFRYKGSTLENFSIHEGLTDIIWSMTRERDGTVWFGSQGSGAIKYNGKSFVHFTMKNGLANNTVFSMLPDTQGSIWFATNGGICKYDGSSFWNLTFPGSDTYRSSVLTVLEDRNGKLWFGTYTNGIYCLDGDSLIQYTEKEGLPNNCVWSLLEDDLGDIWIGTEGGGLTKFDGHSFSYYSENEGLLSNDIAGIVKDENANLWVSTERGLNCLIEEEKPGDKRIVSYDKKDGLKSPNFISNSITIDRSNRLWTGNGNNATVLNLNNLITPKKAPSIELVNVEINESHIDFKNIEADSSIGIDFKNIYPFSNYPLGLKLSYENNHLTFYFSAVECSAPHKVLYSYHIRELNKNWSIPNNEPKADYRNLPYGKYNFEVKAINIERISSQPFIYSFEILPPWWHTWWARVSYFLIGLLSLFSFVRWRTNNLEKRQKELEQEIETATKEIRTEKDRSEELLLNILPKVIAEELKEKGSAEAQLFDQATVLFTDFKGFTEFSALLSPEKLVHEINLCFSAFDKIMEKHNIEKIKTIGDAYMAAGGLPTPNETHAIDVVRAAIEIQEFMLSLAKQKKANNQPYFEIRIGVHTGPVVAGIVGVKKFQYDIWGDTVNTASRMETTGAVGMVNISETTHAIIKDYQEYRFESRGKIEAKGKGLMEMFFVSRKDFS